MNPRRGNIELDVLKDNEQMTGRLIATSASGRLIIIEDQGVHFDDDEARLFIQRAVRQVHSLWLADCTHAKPPEKLSIVPNACSTDAGARHCIARLRRPDHGNCSVVKSRRRLRLYYSRSRDANQQQPASDQPRPNDLTTGHACKAATVRIISRMVEIVATRAAGMVIPKCCSAAK